MDDSIFLQLDYADGICLLCPWIMNRAQVALDLGTKASKIGLKINNKKTNVLSLTVIALLNMPSTGIGSLKMGVRHHKG